MVERLVPREDAMNDTISDSPRAPRLARTLLFLVNLVVWLNWFALGIFVIAGVAFALGAVPADLEVPVPLRLDHMDRAAETAPRLLQLEGMGTVFLGDGDRRSAMVFVGLLLLNFAFAQYGAYQLRGIVRAIGGGHPFDPEVPRRFVRLGLLLLVRWPVYNLAALGFARHLVEPLTGRGLSLRPTVPEKEFTWLLAGLFCLLLAAAFRAGQQLQAEHDLTV
jgi:hypothetical protein